LLLAQSDSESKLIGGFDEVGYSTQLEGELGSVKWKDGTNFSFGIESSSEIGGSEFMSISKNSVSFSSSCIVL